MAPRARAGATLVGGIKEVACVCQASDARGRRQHGTHSVDVEEDSEAASAAAADDDVGSGGQAVSAVA
jgi:hypothetical protein